MVKITLNEILDYEATIGNVAVGELRACGCKDVYVEDLWEVLNECVNLGMSFRVVPLNRGIVTVSI